MKLAALVIFAVAITSLIAWHLTLLARSQRQQCEADGGRYVPPIIVGKVIIPARCARQAKGGA